MSMCRCLLTLGKVSTIEIYYNYNCSMHHGLHESVQSYLLCVCAMIPVVSQMRAVRESLCRRWLMYGTPEPGHNEGQEEHRVGPWWWTDGKLLHRRWNKKQCSVGEIGERRKAEINIFRRPRRKMMSQARQRASGAGLA